MSKIHYHARYTPITFDPNDNTKSPWATYITARNGPDFKVHRTRGTALNAFSNRNHGCLYEWDNDNSRWVEVLRREYGAYPRECADCAVTLPEGNAYHGSGNWVIVRDRSRKVIEPVQQKYVCTPCKRGI